MLMYDLLSQGVIERLGGVVHVEGVREGLHHLQVVEPNASTVQCQSWRSVGLVLPMSWLG